MDCPNCGLKLDEIVAVKTLERHLTITHEDNKYEGRALGKNANHIGDTESYICPYCQVEIEMPDNFVEVD